MYGTVFKNLLNVSKSVLKLEEIMWKNDYVQLKIKVKDIYFFNLNVSLLSFFI